MKLYFLPLELRQAIECLNINFLTEIRIRRGQPVIIEYRGEYAYINATGICPDGQQAIKIYDVDGLFSAAVSDGIYAYTEQLKGGFVTLDGGVRIGVAGQYVSQNGCITAVTNITSLNIRIPHDIKGCSQKVYRAMGYKRGSVLIFSRPGLGKTTMLRDLARKLGECNNVLIVDERSEISAFDGHGDGYVLGERCDVVRGGSKQQVFAHAIRAMKPQVIITDELYGSGDFEAIKYAVDCGISVCASTHIVDRNILKDLPFEFFCQLTGIGGEVVVYDKNFDIVRDNSGDDGCGSVAFGR